MDIGQEHGQRTADDLHPAAHGSYLRRQELLPVSHQVKHVPDDGGE